METAETMVTILSRVVFLRTSIQQNHRLLLEYVRAFSFPNILPLFHLLSLQSTHRPEIAIWQGWQKSATYNKLFHIDFIFFSTPLNPHLTNNSPNQWRKINFLHPSSLPYTYTLSPPKFPDILNIWMSVMKKSPGFYYILNGIPTEENCTTHTLSREKFTGGCYMKNGKPKSFTCL